jgi:hypothetical protein
MRHHVTWQTGNRKLVLARVRRKADPSPDDNCASGLGLRTKYIAKDATAMEQKVAASVVSTPAATQFADDSELTTVRETSFVGGNLDNSDETEMPWDSYH